jgi:HAE1 family hydrophobic/amphiphilic exporter-1
MKLVETAIKRPVTVMVGAILLVLFGFISLYRIPIQLTPNVDLPEVSVETRWEGASPQEVEREIVDAQEEELKNLEGLDKMESESRDGYAYIDLMFEIGTDPDDALLRVSKKLDQVRKYPANADKPLIKSGGRQEEAIAWMALDSLEGYQGVLNQEVDFINDQVKPFLERIDNIASVNVYGGRERELSVTINTEALAARKITIPELMRSLDVENRNVSAGSFDEGKRKYVTRTVGEFRDAADVENVIIKRVNGIPVTMGEVSRAKLDYEKLNVVVRHEGKPTIVMNAVREPGSNVLVVMKRLQEVLKNLNDSVLKDRKLIIRQVYDETGYIYSAIDLVKQNIFLGGILAVVVLILFLRNIASTVIVSVAIPISIIATFLVMTLLGRNINVVSLAGLSFAVGMVVDNSIVVFENIFRHREMGKSRVQAAYDGTVEVWGAVLASTLTTVAVFLPIVFVQEEAGQLFRDIAIAISSAVFLSLVVSITGIPTLSAKLLGRVHTAHPKKRHRFSIMGLAGGFVNLITRFIYWMCGYVTARVLVVLVLTSLSVSFAVGLIPKTEYLPQGNREMLFGILIPPPGYNQDEMKRIASEIEKDILPLINHEGDSEMALKLNLPPLESFFFVAFGQQAFMGIMSKVQERTRELLPYIYGTLRKIPGMIAVVQQPGLFARGIGKGRSIEVEITGPDLVQLIRLGQQVFGGAMQALPGAQIRPIPSLDLGSPEMQIVPDRDRLTRLGLTTADLGTTVNVLVDGARASGYRFQGEEIDLMVKTEENRISKIQDLAGLPVISPSGDKVTLSSVANISLTEGPSQINHLHAERAITIQIIPPLDIALETATQLIAAKIIDPLESSGVLGNLYHIKIGGTADNLTRTRDALLWNFLLALVISYLLMSALFENFLYPFIIMFSVPLAAAGGFVGLFLLNRFLVYQPLDIITMLGFVMLVGIVVNNAILIVHQTLNNMRNAAMASREAIAESVRSRIRPIYMSSITTVCAMTPLVLSPGAGSEFYRGLGSVVIGGILVSTIFTIFLIPALLSLTLDTVTGLKKILRIKSTNT